MQSVTNRFLSTLLGSHQSVTQLDILKINTWPVANVISFIDGAASTGTSPSIVVDGYVTADKTATYRRTCNITIIDPTQAYLPRFDCIPTDQPSDYFCPFGRHIRLWRGVQYPDGTKEMVCLGIFRIVEVTITDDPKSGGFKYTVSGYDISRTVGRNKVDSTGASGIPNTVPYVVAAGTTYGQAIHDFIVNALPSGSAQFPTTATDGGFGNVILGVQGPFGAGAVFTTQPLIGGAAGIVPAVYSDGTDPWSEAVKMASLCGCQLYVDVNGVFTMVQEPLQPNNNATPTYTIAEGSNLIKVERKLTDQNAYNKVVVSGEGVNLTGVAPSAEARDLNDNSPTWIGVNPDGSGQEGSSAYGKVTNFTSDSLVIDTPTAQAAANMELAAALGSHEKVSVDCIPNPALDVNDVIVIQRNRIALDGINNFYIDSIKYPLSPKSPMTIITRQVLTQ